MTDWKENDRSHPSVAVSLTDVFKTYHVGEPVHALEDISLSIPQGSFTAVMGPSGSGKSTLMNLIGCLDTPTEGTVHIGDHDVTALSDRDRTGLRGGEIGFIFQTFNLMPRLTAWENVALPLVFQGWPRDERRTRAQELLERVGLGDRVDHRPNELSGGQRQRVAIARALANDPALILADEPTGNLDRETGERIMRLLQRLNDDGRTIVLVTHERPIAEYAERVIHLVDGTVERTETISAPRGVATERGVGKPPSATPSSGIVSGVVESGRLSWRSIRDRPLQSMLTTLGIVIGVAAVITFVTLGTSLQVAIIGDIVGQTSPEMMVFVGPSEGSSPGGGRSVLVFTEYDLANLRSLSNVDAVIPRGTIRVTALGHGNQTIAWQRVTATVPAAFEDRTFESGSAFTQGERELVLNQPAAVLFEPNVSVGDRLTVRLGSGETVTATVAGILNSSSEAGVFGGIDVPPRVYVPTDPFYTTTVESPSTGAQQQVYPLVTVRATSFEVVPTVETAVETYLTRSSDARRLKPESYTFTVRTSEQLVDQIRGVLTTFTGFITSIAVVSLIVGAIGIANIMLASVTERTREIGIMKAIGARKRTILELFLVEAVILGVVGAIVGTGVGVVGGYLATDYVDIAPVFAPEWFAIAVVVGITVGIVAGVYPAWNAARVDPIEALRYE